MKQIDLQQLLDKLKSVTDKGSIQSDQATGGIALLSLAHGGGDKDKQMIAIKTSSLMNDTDEGPAVTTLQMKRSD